MSGRSFQFSVGSAVSFQFQAGFTSTYYARQQPDNRLKPRPGAELARPSDHGLEATRSAEAPFYEVVGPYSNGAAASTPRAAPATIALPAQASEEIALVSAELPSTNRQIAEAYRREAETHHKFADGETAYVHSYNQNGQRVFAMTEIPTIDMTI
ncbi:hypothetical protein ACFL6S_21125 [Candidatus Poribacteria bacterium]